MALTLRIERKYFFAGLIVLGLVLGGVIVWAQITPIPNPGHYLSELQKCGQDKILKINDSEWTCADDNEGGGGGIGGSGTINKIPVFTASNTIGDSPIYTQDGNLGVRDTTDTLIFSIVRSGNIPIVRILNQQESGSALAITTKSNSASYHGLAFYSGTPSTEKFKLRSDGAVCINNVCKTSWPNGNGSITFCGTVSTSGTGNKKIGCSGAYPGTSLVGGGAECSGSMITKSFPNGNNEWEAFCSGGTTVFVYARCCK